MDKFFELDGKFYIILEHTVIEVCQEVYTVYKNNEYSTEYSNRKYNKWNKSLDEDSLVSAKYEYISSKKEPGFEDTFVYKEEFNEKLQQLCEIDKFILKRLLSGYNQIEIANELGISHPAVTKRKKKIKKML